MKLLTGKEINTADYKDLPRSWYAPREFFTRYKSVVGCVLTDTTSSAGDWSGYIAQKRSKRTYIIPFSQSNNYPYAGFTAFTSEIPAISYVGDMSEKEICSYLYKGL